MPFTSLGRVILGLLTFGLSAVAFSGYFTGLETTYGWGNLTRMAVHTSVGFICLSIGLICFVWSRDIREEARLPRWFPVLLAIAILTATLSFWQALAVENALIHDQYEELSQLSSLATVMLIVGTALALAMALAAFLAQKAQERSREVQRTSQLSHPNTISIYDYGRTPEGGFYYAMEYLDGITLEELVEKHGPQPDGRVVELLKHFSGALAEAQENSLIHRSTETSNLPIS
jgi:serine/threonine protein kinase